MVPFGDCKIGEFIDICWGVQYPGPYPFAKLWMGLFVGSVDEPWTPLLCSGIHNLDGFRRAKVQRFLKLCYFRILVGGTIIKRCKQQDFIGPVPHDQFGISVEGKHTGIPELVHDFTAGQPTEGLMNLVGVRLVGVGWPAILIQMPLLTGLIFFAARTLTIRRVFSCFVCRFVAQLRNCGTEVCWKFRCGLVYLQGRCKCQVVQRHTRSWQ